jgi:hypothetical protein
VEFAALDGLGAAFLMDCPLAGLGRLVIRSTTSAEIAVIGIFAVWGAVPRRWGKPTITG